MPVGYWKDIVLLDAAIAFRNVTSFHTRRPSLIG